MKKQRTKKTLKAFLLAFLSAIMLFLMAFQAYKPIVVGAEEVPVVGKNLLNMDTFVNYIFKSEDMIINTCSDYGVELEVTFTDVNKKLMLTSGYTNLSPGVYTLSNHFEFKSIHPIAVSADVGYFYYDNESEISVFEKLYTTNIDNNYNNNTFTVLADEEYAIRLWINYIGTDTDIPYTKTFNLTRIQLEKGESATAFVPFGVVEDVVIDEIPGAIDNQTNQILKGMEELFGSDSGIIAGASLGTVIILLFILLKLFRR